MPFGCNNPTAAFAPNGTLFVVCHNGPFEMYYAHPTPTQPAWTQEFLGPIPLFALSGPGHPNAPGNCEDPWLWFDRKGFFHIIAHCYTCYWYPASQRPIGGGSARGNCSDPSTTCSGHGFSRWGSAGTWTWVGGPDAPYGFTSHTRDGGEYAFSTRERPWGLMGGEHGDQVLALVNGVSPKAPEHVKYVKGKDWCFTNIQTVSP